MAHQNDIPVSEDIPSISFIPLLDFIDKLPLIENAKKNEIVGVNYTTSCSPAGLKFYDVSFIIKNRKLLSFANALEFSEKQNIPDLVKEIMIYTQIRRVRITKNFRENINWAETHKGIEYTKELYIFKNFIGFIEEENDIEDYSDNSCAYLATEKLSAHEKLALTNHHNTINKFLTTEKY